MRKYTKITELTPANMKPAEREIVRQAEYLLKEALRHDKMDFPDLTYALLRMPLVPVREKIGISTDGLRFLYNPEDVLRLGNFENHLEAHLVHIVMHGMLGHYDAAHTYVLQQKTAFQLMDMQAEYFVRFLAPKEWELSPVAFGYTDLFSAISASDFPHSFYLRCLTDKSLRSGVNAYGNNFEWDNHWLWLLPPKKKQEKEEKDSSHNTSSKKSSNSTTDSNQEKKSFQSTILAEKTESDNSEKSRSENFDETDKGASGNVYLSYQMGNAGGITPQKSLERFGSPSDVRSFWETARSFVSGSSFGNSIDCITLKFSHSYGNSPGNCEMVYDTAKGTPQSYRALLWELARMLEGTGEDPETPDQSLYQYGLSLYDNVPLIEPADEALSPAVGTLVIAIDTSGSCCGETASVFLRETRQMLTDLQSIGKFRELCLVECDTTIQNVRWFRNPSELPETEKPTILHGGGGTDFRPVFNFVQKIEQEEGPVDALIYLTDGYGSYPQTPREHTWFVMESTHFNHDTGLPEYSKFPDWINPLCLE